MGELGEQHDVGRHPTTVGGPGREVGARQVELGRRVVAHLSGEYAVAGQPGGDEEQRRPNPRHGGALTVLAAAREGERDGDGDNGRERPSPVQRGRGGRSAQSHPGGGSWEGSQVAHVAWLEMRMGSPGVKSPPLQSVGRLAGFERI